MNPQSSISGTILAPGRTIPFGTVHWSAAGIITHVEETAPEPGTGGAAPLVCPGFINLHVHGGSGVDTLDGSIEAFAALSADQARQGVTAFLPTTASAPRSDLEAVCRAVAQYPGGHRRHETAGAEILGLHLEGPYFSPEKAGAQNPAHFRDPDWPEFEALQEISGGAVRLVSLAPERDPGGGFIRGLQAAGVRAAAGHTTATYEQMQAAVEAGVRHATHTFNGMPGIDHRTPGGTVALLEDDRVMLELIPDCGEVPHVHPAVIRLLKRIAGVDRICTITDAISAAGGPDGAYRLGGLAVRKFGDVVVLEEPWRERQEQRLAGSVLAMNAAVRNLVRLAGFTLDEAVRTATANPARALGIEREKGSLEPGRHADITALDPDTLEVAATFVRGRQVYGRG